MMSGRIKMCFQFYLTSSEDERGRILVIKLWQFRDHQEHVLIIIIIPEVCVCMMRWLIVSFPSSIQYKHSFIIPSVCWARVLDVLFLLPQNKISLLAVVSILYDKWQRLDRVGGRTIKRQGVTLPRIPVLKHHQHLLGKKSRVLYIVKMYRRLIGCASMEVDLLLWVEWIEIIIIILLCSC